MDKSNSEVVTGLLGLGGEKRREAMNRLSFRQLCDAIVGTRVADWELKLLSERISDIAQRQWELSCDIKRSIVGRQVTKSIGGDSDFPDWCDGSDCLNSVLSHAKSLCDKASVSEIREDFFGQIWTYLDKLYNAADSSCTPEKQG